MLTTLLTIGLVALVLALAASAVIWIGPEPPTSDLDRTRSLRETYEVPVARRSSGTMRMEEADRV